MSNFTVTVSPANETTVEVQNVIPTATVEVGTQGPQGVAASIAVGTVQTVAPGAPAEVQNTGSSLEAVLAFKIPKGDKGETGDPFSNVDGGTANSVYGGVPPIDGGSA